jgi:predicted metal-dependent enzyme (double-stranded beta helix superfamily)
MDPLLEQFVADCRRLLKADQGPAGRNKVRERLEKLLRAEAFLDRQLSNKTSERELLYEDPELGFCILAHSYRDARSTPLHDHGPSWAIYGQARGETEVTEYELIEPASESGPGRARPRRSYVLTPGRAQLYNEGDVHSLDRKAPTQLIRIEGRNMERVKRLRFQAV